MLDYRFEGRPVAEMSMEEIQRCLEDGVVVHDGTTPEDAVIERLRIELDIRRIEGRL